jgi:NADH:ubiquinone oxidoreductase subunit 2 (subunit N)
LHFFKYQKKINVEYIYFLIFLPLSLILLLNSTDLIYVYIIIELSSLLLYILIVSKKYSNYSSEASLKYFILSSLSSCFLLFGIALFYGMTGTTDLFEFNKLFLNFNVYNEYYFGCFLSCLFIFFGFLFKLGIFPFHV